MKRWIMLVSLAAVCAVAVGCSNVKIKVEEKYLMAPGQTIALQAPAGTPAGVLKVKLDIKDLNLPAPLNQLNNVSGSAWLIINADVPAPMVNSLKAVK